MQMIQPLCVINTPFPEKFGVPRQPLLVPEAWGRMSFPKNDFYLEAFRGLEESSHLWLIFEFHQIQAEAIQALVRPPRFEGKQKLGVFATRSPHRPNRLGLSVVQFDRVEILNQEVVVWVKGVDLVDGTPILDIKPYVPYVDSVPEARSLYQEKPEKVAVKWLCDFKGCEKKLIEQVVSLDPRPGHQKDSLDDYGISIAGHNVIFCLQENTLVIKSLSRE